MRKFCLTLAILSLSMKAPTQEVVYRNNRTGEQAGYATRDATVLSMMGWGVGLAAGIAALCALLEEGNENGSGHSH